MALANIPDFLETIHLALSNLQADPDLHAPMAVFGYDAAKIDSLMALYEAAAASCFTQITQYAQQYGATAAYNDAIKAAKTRYARHLKLARVVYKDNITRSHQLGLQGIRQQNFYGWKGQAEQFYAAALADPAVQAELATVGLTLSALQDAKTLIDAAEDAWNTQKKEAGEAQAATQTRNAALKALRTAYGDLIAVARVAFADDGQKLERMGIVVS